MDGGTSPIAVSLQWEPSANKPTKKQLHMGKIGKISTIKKDYNNSQLQTMQGGLASRGYTRIPGTGVFKYPYKELDGQYRTGLDPKAAYIRRISDPLKERWRLKE
jgi:hypothetical protein